MRAAVLPVIVLLPLAGAATAGQPTPPSPQPGNPTFTYPEDARRQGITGELRYSIEVDVAGAATAVKVTSVPKEGLGFEAAVEPVLRRWRFAPATADGKPVPGTYDGSISFRLFPADEKEIASLVSRVAAAWNAEAADSVVAQIAPTDPADPMAALVRPVEAERTWVTEQVARHEAMAAAPRSIQFLSGTTASVEIPREGLAEPLTALFGKRAGHWALVRMSAGAPRMIETSIAPVRVGRGIKEPRKIKDKAPHYPEAAKQSRVQGTVILEAYIDPEGNVTDLKVLRGIPLLNEAAIKAVQQWKYTPTLLEGVPVPVIMTVTVNFRLR
jgi:TonB family protein